VSLTFPYARFQVQQPLLTLGGRRERPRPVVGITVIGPTDSRYVHGLLDTGADDTLFPEALAQKIGIDLSNAPTLTGAGFGMVAHPVRLAEVVLRLTDCREQREWKALVGFTAAKMRQPLLGYAGLLQFFSATFHGDREVVELITNTTYPGT
jgi:predicted aspartyl protease